MPPEPLHLWMRHETRPSEQRAPITPSGVAQLVAAGVRISVEHSPVRVFQDSEYGAAGAQLVPTGGWVEAPASAVIIGLKELTEDPAELRHRHVFFGHAYKGQPGARSLLQRFRDGEGTLLDLEYLVDDHGRRVAAFGFWAGYIGAALGVLQTRGELSEPLRPMTRDDLDTALRSTTPQDAPERAIVVGALGRSGSGAVAALRVAGSQLTGWDRTDTEVLDRAALLDHDLFVHCVLATEPGEPLLRTEDLDAEGRRLRVLSDVTCDLGSDLNLVPVNDEYTSWGQPARVIAASHGPDLEVIAIDNLPSLLPREASIGFSDDLLPHLLALVDGSPTWNRAASLFDHHTRRVLGETPDSASA